MMYKSPIDVLIEDVKMQFEKGVDEQVHQAVVHVGINVDKAELLRALAYDREQYVKGYAEGLEDAVKHGRWVDRYGGKYANKCFDCSECKGTALYKPEADELGHWRFVQALSDNCPHCGARMDGGNNNG